jgi:hypothetical protein
MRLTSICMCTSSAMDEEIIFAVEEQDPNYRYLVRGMAGIDADDLVFKYSGTGKVSGKKFYDQTMPPRDIVMRVSLNPRFAVNESVSDLRDVVYRLIASSRSPELNLQFRDGPAIVCDIYGIITKTEVVYFSKQPELQITLKCNDPMFRSVLMVSELVSELPSTNPIVIKDEASSAPHGFSFKVKFTAVTSSFTIQDTAASPDWLFKVQPATSFQINDELHFSSEYGKKKVFWNKVSGTDIDLMDKVSNDSIWPQIFPMMDNVFYFLPIANTDWLEFNYRSAYWAI